jgi:hypothetical protein
MSSGTATVVLPVARLGGRHSGDENDHDCQRQDDYQNVDRWRHAIAVGAVAIGSYGRGQAD